ncbi:hypothetical protein RvY_13377 [Ramazzottius varieornatus]|uniref:DOMON domain-containing protein n=1 Tax=Ramazzottius varieornatus TaxID=947166 RepID=A0A1D1VMP2_RAMVA|nr:hypothetical protein RvY_13377 [Ramazzottius varieornatus]
MLYWAVLFIGAVSATPIRMDHRDSLDFGSAHGEARWGINSTHLEMELAYPTKGWVAFGLSPDGHMDDADFLFGYVDDATKEVVVQDRHVVEDHAMHDTMMMDGHQDWTRISGMQNNTHTVIRAIRKLQTCDKDDHPFTLDSQHAVFAMDSRDPPSKSASISLETTAKTGTEPLDFSHAMSATDMKSANFRC